VSTAHHHPSLKSQIPAAHLAIVERLGQTFHAAGKELVLVGGIVRDMLLEIELPTDLDFATNALPEETEQLGLAGGAESSYLIGAHFGTVGLVFRLPNDDMVNVEITTYRAEHYPDDTRKPAVEWGETLEDDLSRRDFTVNAMAADPLTGEIIDPYGGQADLAMAIIRAVGDPEARFREDPLRLLRGARFVAQLGFAVEARTFDAMIAQAPSLARISKERIYAELTRLLTGPYASHGLDTLADTGQFQQVLPDIAFLPDESPLPGGPHLEKDLWEHTKRVVDRSAARPVVRWSALLHDAGKPLCRSIAPNGEIHFIGHEREGGVLASKVLARLNADRATQAAVRRIVELHGRPESYDDSWTDSAVRRLMLDAGDQLDDLLELVAADVTSARTEKQTAARKRIDALRAHIARLEAERALGDYQSPLDGQELMALFNRPPGKWIGDIKDALREMVIDGDLEPEDKSGAAAIATRLLAMLDQGKGFDTVS
jgi:poly(A) polymerase